MAGVHRWGHLVWLGLAAVATLLAVGGVLDALWRVMHGDFVGLVTLPIGLLFWYWIGVGAWRRAVPHVQLPISRRVVLRRRSAGGGPPAAGNMHGMVEAVSDESARRVARWRRVSRVAWAISGPMSLLRVYTLLAGANDGMEDMIAIVWLVSTGAALLAMAVFERASNRWSGAPDA